MVFQAQKGWRFEEDADWRKGRSKNSPFKENDSVIGPS
jgi:hypothetical protein